MAVCKNTSFPGYPRLLRMKGHELSLVGFNGDYVLSLDSSVPVWHRRNKNFLVIPVVDTAILFDENEEVWVMKSSCNRFKFSSVYDSLTPAGLWRQGISVEAVIEQLSIIALLAFPAPKMDLNFYQTWGDKRACSAKSFQAYPAADRFRGCPALLSHPDLVLLNTTENERIPALHIKHRPTSNNNLNGVSSNFTIIYSHGNGEDLGLILSELTALSLTTGASVFAYEYVGYSLSRLEGMAPSEAGCYRSIAAAWAYLTKDIGIPPQQLILFGRSIGTGPTVDLATQVEGRLCGGVVLQSPLASGARVLLGGAGVAVRGLDIFTNYTKIGQIDSPVAIMHGREDSVVPFASGELLYELLKKPAFTPLWIDGRGHNNMPTARCMAYVTQFIHAVKSGQADSAQSDVTEQRSRTNDDTSAQSEDCNICNLS